MHKPDNQFITKLDRLIDENLADPKFSIDSICQRLGLSRSQLHRVLKDQTSLSTSRYIRQRRLLQARHLLSTTDLRISEICDQVGITNYQNFSTYFAEEFSVNPTDFRKSAPTFIVAEPNKAAVPVLATEPNSVTHSSVRPQPQVRQSWRFPALGLGVLVLIAAGGYLFWKDAGGQSSTNPVPSSLAVMPFTNLSGPESSPACESIMDNIYTSVSLIDNLKVIARSSSDQYLGTSKSVWQIGNELGVANVLKGNFLKIGDTIQLKIEIIGTPDADLGGTKQAWHKTYSTVYQDIFKLTDEVVADVARQLNLTTRTADSQNRLLARTQNLEAYNAFLQGRQLMLSRNTADLQESLVRLNYALSLDSSFAEVWAFKAATTLLLPSAGEVATQKKYHLTEQYALNAIRLDPTNSTAYGVLGALYHTTHQWQAGENAFRIALQHNPNDAQINYWYSILLRSMGRVDEAVEYSTRAVALDPLYPIILAGHMLNCVYADRMDLAKKSLENGRVLFDKSFAYHMADAYYYLAQNDYTKAVAEFNRAFVLNPDDQGNIPLIMYCEAKRGNRQKATAFLQGLTSATPWDHYQRAVVYAGLSEADSSLHYLKKAADEGYYFRDTKVTPVFQPYHNTLAFRAVLRRYNLAD